MHFHWLHLILTHIKSVATLSCLHASMSSLAMVCCHLSMHGVLSTGWPFTASDCTARWSLIRLAPSRGMFPIRRLILQAQLVRAKLCGYSSPPAHTMHLAQTRPRYPTAPKVDVPPNGRYGIVSFICTALFQIGICPCRPFTVARTCLLRYRQPLPAAI